MLRGRYLIMNIVVLAGGLSTERDVSLTTGARVLKSLKRLGHSAVLIDFFFWGERSCLKIWRHISPPPEEPDIGRG